MNDIKISDKTREFQVIALSITGNPDASINDCIATVLDLVPSLRNYFTILEQNEKGNLKCKISKYAFTTPSEKQVAKSPPRQTSKSNVVDSSNRYAQLTTDDDDDDGKEKDYFIKIRSQINHLKDKTGSMTKASGTHLTSKLKNQVYKSQRHHHRQ